MPLRRLVTAVALSMVPALASGQVSVGSEFQVNTYTTGRQEFASLSRDAAGNFVTAWTSYVQEGPANPGIYAQRFQPDLIFRDGFEAGN
jgi:hypothetical protein